MNQESKKGLVVYGGYQMINRILDPRPGQRGWAHYPKEFFGVWEPANNIARRSIRKPKMVTFIPIVGWMFDIELRAYVTKDSCAPVGCVYFELQGSIKAPCIPGLNGYLATTENRRIKMVCLPH